MPKSNVWFIQVIPTILVKVHGGAQKTGRHHQPGIISKNTDAGNTVKGSESHNNIDNT